MSNYSIFVIDPPWPQSQGGRRSVRPKQKGKFNYNTLTINEIFSLLDKEVFPKASQDHCVFLWEIDKFLLDAEVEMMARGYRRHTRIVWNKTNGIAPAFTLRFIHEYLVWWYKEKFMPVAVDARGRFTTIITEQAREHSRKPNTAYLLIDILYPDKCKLDVFSREKREGWDQFGDESNYY